MKYSQISKKTKEILNNIVVDNGYIFDGNYDWTKTDDYIVEVGDFYIDGVFYKSDKKTIIEKIPTTEDKLILAENKIEDLYNEKNLLKQENTALAQAMLDMQVNQSLKEMGV